MKKFKQIREEVFTLVHMDDASVKIAVKLAKKAGLRPKISKGKLGTDLRVDGPFKKVMKFANSLPNESVVNEARITVHSAMFNFLNKEIKQLMKKHDAYINKSETDKTYTTISTPSASFEKDYSALMKKHKKKIIQHFKIESNEVMESSELMNEALNLVLSFGLKGNLPDGDGKKLIDTFAKKARVKVKHMMGGFEVYGDPISQNRFLNSVVNSKPLLKYLDTK
tara:strand:- start:2274 stop:2945 length:672 start_codon:yes stop_codon:yes gene_type:complete